ncbi:hypothetical protein BASA50_010075 [Batrachochytrium salamandrivorans]|uniref:Uncharacterized protein n=1 Tax=Batrachochytrium salamandrivorans TaxID=1357716 RepID=A0ABQ8EZL8_9FUNG|nr:hypothetical protein BASA50_010075 [Batrachochytrium salamandrivorans]
MLSRLIITFLCAAAIGSVSNAFLTFDTNRIEFEDIERPISLSAKLNSKPTEEVTVYFEHPFLSMSTCVIVFSPNNWNVPQEITANPAPLFVGLSEPPGPIEFNSELLAKAAAVGPLPAELSITDTLKSYEEEIYLCAFVPLQRMESTPLTRYPSSLASLAGIRWHPLGIPKFSNYYQIDFSYGSVLNAMVVNRNGIVSLRVDLFLDHGYSSSDGLCNTPRPPSPDNKLIGSDGTLYKSASSEVDAFVRFMEGQG